MKNKLFTAIAIVLLCVVSSVTQASDIDRVFNDYDIVAVSSNNLENGVDKAWVLSYDNNESQISITLHQNKRSKYFVVRGESFEIAYECCKKGFGATYVKSSYSEVPFVLTSSVINESELNKQRILTSEQITDEKAVELIAAYLPDLVNPSYKHLLN